MDVFSEMNVGCSVARADEGECGELAENAFFHTAGNFVVQVWWACGGRVTHQVWHRWYDPVKGRRELSGIRFLYSCFWTCLHILKHIWLKWLKCFIPAPRNIFVDPERSTVFGLVLNCWTSLEIPVLWIGAEKWFSFNYYYLVGAEVGFMCLMISWHLPSFFVF